MARLTAPIPLQDPIAKPRRTERFKPGEKDPQEGRLTDGWANYFTQFAAQVLSAPSRIYSTQLTEQGASLPLTNLVPGDAVAGIYRATWYARITRAASTSSSLTVTLTWTDNAVTPSYSGTAITGNLTTTTQSETFTLNSDALSPIQVSTTYASVGGTSMQYKLTLVLEQIQ